MKEPFRKKIAVPVYGPPLAIILFVAEDITELIKRYDNEYAPGDEQCEAYNILNWPRAYILLKTRSLTWDCIVHEVDQLTHKIKREIGVTESNDSEEEYAYFTGWLAKQVIPPILSEGFDIV